MSPETTELLLAAAKMAISDYEEPGGYSRESRELSSATYQYLLEAVEAAETETQ